jgi:hypothetical protein
VESVGTDGKLFLLAVPVGAASVADSLWQGVSLKSVKENVTYDSYKLSVLKDLSSLHFPLPFRHSWTSPRSPYLNRSLLNRRELILGKPFLWIN